MQQWFKKLNEMHGTGNERICVPVAGGVVCDILRKALQGRKLTSFVSFGN